MFEKYDYLSDRTVEGQQEYLNDFITKINTNVDNGTIEVKSKDISNENERALTTDTHGDLMSMMGAAVMCGVKFKENEFLYYDRNEGIYYEKVDEKYYEYIPPYIGEKKQGKPIDKIAEDNSITVVPIPDTSNARELYHLGDVLDRGQESLTSLLLCEVCPNIKLAQGNHEFSDSMNKYYGYKKEIPSINLALARMKHNGRINTVYYDGKGDDVISYSHIPLTEDHVIGFFNFLKAVYIDEKYSYKKPLILEFLNKEFEKQLGLKYGYLLNKINTFLKNNNELTFNKIISNSEENYSTKFTIEEMLIIKNVVSGALIERQFEVGEDGKITFVNGGFDEIYYEFDELQGGLIVNFDRDHENKAINSSVMGHTPEMNKITNKGNNKCLDIDDMKSANFVKTGENEYKSCATVTNLNIKTGIVEHSSFTVKREEEGEISFYGYIKRENNNITNNFQKNESGHDMQTLNNFKLPTEIIIDVKPIPKNINFAKINKYIHNIFRQDNINLELIKNLLDYSSYDEKLHYITIKNIFDKAYEEKKYEIVEIVLNYCIYNNILDISEEFIYNFLTMSNFICGNQDKYQELSEKFIESINNKDDLILKLFNLANKYKIAPNMINKLLESKVIENSLDIYINKINDSNTSEEFIYNFLTMSNFICGNQDKYQELSEKFIESINDKDDLILKLFILANTYNFTNIIDKLLAKEDFKNKLNESIIDIEKLTFDALDNGNIDMAKVLIKHGFKFDTKELTRKKEEFKTFENTLISLAKEYNIKKENFEKINFSLVVKNIFKYKTIKKSEFERLNNVLNLIKEQIEIEINPQIQQH